MAEAQDLNHVLGQFERVDSNLRKLETVWETLQSVDGEKHEGLVRSFENLLPGLPAIDGFEIHALPMSHSDAQLMRVQASDVGEPEVLVAAEQEIGEPGRQIAEYRFRFDQARRTIVRDRIAQVMSDVDALVGPGGRLTNAQATTDWDELTTLVPELDRLVADSVPRAARWNDILRHLHFGTDVDLHDIITMDWPSVRAEIEEYLYDDNEPLPVTVDDLGEMVRARPTGPVSTKLTWSNLTDEDFESLVFELVRTAEGYENTNWLMQTHAPDRGRDIETYRVHSDPLSGTSRSRVLVQCKHWASRSVNLSDLTVCLETVQLWEPPRVDSLVVATSGRFTQDAVAWIEKRREERAVPAVEPWPNSHLEALVSRRPGIAARFGLR